MERETVAGLALAAGAALVIYRARQRTSADTTWSVGANWPSKRAQLAACSPSDLLVITDFDATVTTGDSEQCHDLMGASQLMSDDFRKEFAPLLDWTTDTNIDGVKWWDTAHALVVKHGMPRRNMIPRLVRDARMVPRPGVLELLAELEELNVPVLIVSAGVSDIIEEFLRQHGALSENVTVCSNRLNYAADSAPSSVSPDPPITSFTKAYAYSSSSAFFRQHAARKSLIVLGDSVTDVDASINVPHDVSLSVGFLNSRPDATKHSAAFDCVVHGDRGSLAPVAELLNEIAPGKMMGRTLSNASSLDISSGLRRSPSMVRKSPSQKRVSPNYKRASSLHRQPTDE